MSPELAAINRLERRIIGLEKLALKQADVWLTEEEVLAQYKDLTKKALYRLRTQENSPLSADDWKCRNRIHFRYRKAAIEALYK